MLDVEIAALPASLRRTNQRTLISLRQRLGSDSKADLAKAAGVSQPTAGKIVTELPQLGLLEVVCESAPDPRASGLVLRGLDKLVLPSHQEQGLIVQAQSTLQLSN